MSTVLRVCLTTSYSTEKHSWYNKYIVNPLGLGAPGYTRKFHTLTALVVEMIFQISCRSYQKYSATRLQVHSDSSGL